MGHCLEMSTGDMRDVIRLLTAVERTEKQERVLGVVRERCARTDARFREQHVELGVTVSRALDELIEGTPSVEMSPAYTYAFHEAVASHFSDTTDLGVWRWPSWFYRMDDELVRHGVPSDLLPGSFLFSGPPIPMPHPGDGFPSVGILPAQRAAALADVYEAIHQRLSPEYQDTVGKFGGLMRFEAEEFERAQKLGGCPDTIFFWFS